MNDFDSGNRAGDHGQPDRGLVCLPRVNDLEVMSLQPPSGIVSAGFDSLGGEYLPKRGFGRGVLGFGHGLVVPVH